MPKADLFSAIKGKNKHADLQSNLIELIDKLLGADEATAEQKAALARLRAYVIINLKNF